MEKILGCSFRLETKEEIEYMLLNIGEWHPLLDEVIGNHEVGAETFILRDKFGRLVNINQTRFSKSKSSIWRPYANFHLSYTIQAERRKGYARTLLRIVQEYARKNGCRRMKSLAASKEGLSLHLSVNHRFWGRTENNEICIDTPLVECDGWGDRIPPSVIASKLVENFSDIYSLRSSTEKNPLFFDIK